MRYIKVGYIYGNIKKYNIEKGARKAENKCILIIKTSIELRLVYNFNN